MTEAPDTNSNSTIELKGTIKKTPPTSGKKTEDEVETFKFEVIINKNSPATPGDMYLSEFFSLKRQGEVTNTKSIPDKLTLWKPPSSTIAHPDSDYISYCEKRTLEKKLERWNGKESFLIYKRHYDENDIVPAANLPRMPRSRIPRWLVKVDLFVDQAKATESIVRLNAHLSFDEDQCEVLPYKNWRTKPPKEKTFISDIANNILDCNEVEVNKHARDNYINVTLTRIPVGEVEEGEWLLPVFYLGASDNKHLLAYIRVKINYVPQEPVNKAT